MRVTRWLAGTLVLFSMSACDAPMGPNVETLAQHRADWATHNLSRYAYQYEITGFFNALEGRAMRLVVLGDTVRSATFVATGDSVPLTASLLPTIDQLFAEGIAAAQNHTLTGVSFDSVFNYPVEMDLAGPPDAGGSVLASHLELLP
jgi:hypothetical protein